MLHHDFRSDKSSRPPPLSLTAGMTLLELIIACSILMVLSSMALPVFKYTVSRQKESELHYDLRTMKDAIDRYKDLADQHKFRTEVGSENYPPDLETLVKGVHRGEGDERGRVFFQKTPAAPLL